MNAEGKKKAKGGKGEVQLFQPMTLRGVTMRNRIWLPPMDTYSAVAQDGKPTPFHYQHYVSRAMGGFGMIIAEATAVTADGRISPRDVGLWNDDQVAAWHWIVDGIKQAGAVRPCSSTMPDARGRPAASASVSRGRVCPRMPADGVRSRRARSRTVGSPIRAR